MPYLRFSTILACLLGTLSLLFTRGAAAADTTSAGVVAASDFTWKFEAYNPDSKKWVQLNDTEATYFFNRARCECVDDETNYTGYVKIALQPAATTEAKVTAQLANNTVAGAGSARLYAGGTDIDCLAAGTVGIKENCLNLINPGNYDEEIAGGVKAITSTRVWESPPIPVARLFGSADSPRMCGPGGGNSCNATGVCSTLSSKQYIYLWADTTATGVPDARDIKTQIDLVGKVSLTPTDVTVKGGNEALEVTWDWPDGQSPSSQSAVFKGIQIFCVRGADLQVFEDDYYKASYMTAVKTCGDTVGAGEGGLAQYDPRFLCSGLLTSTTNSYRIKGLQNGAPYGVAVAVVDRYLNVSELSDLQYASPIPTVDFYTEYKDLGGAAQGGYCRVATTRRAPGLLALAGLVGFGLLLWRRRRGAGPLAIVLLTSALTAGSARAETIYRYDDMDEVREGDRGPWRGTPRSYAIEARFALYTPDVDSEFSGDGPRPQSFIFGNSRRPMWQLEFDWELLQVFGTLGVGGVVGYFKENAKACEREGLDNEHGECTRSGDNTSLRLIPFAVLAVYRFDVLAERWKIPLVPYGKIGLNYTLWKVTEGNGYTPEAGGGRGAGGTMGWQGAVGISLQLDFLDPNAARGFDADVGVNHTYAFFELAHIDSSGLGSKGKLRVGDDTWFAGLMFEF